MNIFFSDEYNKLNDEITALMQTAGETALVNEFGAKISELNCDIRNLPIDLSVSIVSKDEIQEINAEYRNIDKVTDVLSFPQFDNDELEYELIDLAENIDDDSDNLGVLLGDVVICYDRAIAQAEEYGTGIKRELIYLFVHSIYHLFGYDHMNDDEKSVMRTKEESVMEVLGL